jgi:uncharacterized protein YoxC
VPITPDVLVAAALVILALTSILLVGAVVPMMAQAGRTLSAYEQLAETLKAQVNPTLSEVFQLLDGLNTLRATLTDRVAQVGQQAFAAADSVSLAAAAATKRSSVLAAGLLAGLKSYVEGQGQAKPEGK